MNLHVVVFPGSLLLPTEAQTQFGDNFDKTMNVKPSTSHQMEEDNRPSSSVPTQKTGKKAATSRARRTKKYKQKKFIEYHPKKIKQRLIMPAPTSDAPKTHFKSLQPPSIIADLQSSSSRVPVEELNNVGNASASKVRIAEKSREGKFPERNSMEIMQSPAMSAQTTEVSGNNSKSEEPAPINDNLQSPVSSSERKSNEDMSLLLTFDDPFLSSTVTFQTLEYFELQDALLRQNCYCRRILETIPHRHTGV